MEAGESAKASAVGPVPPIWTGGKGACDALVPPVSPTKEPPREKATELPDVEAETCMKESPSLVDSVSLKPWMYCRVSSTGPNPSTELVV